MSFLRRVQSDSYKVSRLVGDARAAQRGPDVLAKRIIRRKVTASIFRAFGNGRSR